MERIRLLIARIRPATQRIWTGHRVVVIAVSVIAVVAIVAGTLLIAVMPGGTAQAGATPAATATATPTESPLPSDSPSPEPSASAIDLSPAIIPTDWVASDLDGVYAPVDLAHRLPMAISIGDNAVARPQSGFSSASIVYQSYEEYGEDRYMMIFQEGTATDIGGVRSARPYYVRWAAEYKALLGHFGGDTKVLNEVIPAMSGSIYNMDDLNGGSCPYHRTTTRAAPHNAYTNSATLISCLPKKGYPTTYQGGPGRPFVDDTPAADRPASQSITVPYHTVSVGYQFDPATDRYVRLLNDNKQIDPANNQQVFARNIVVMFQTISNDYVDSNGTQRIAIGNVGSGKAIVFKEGKAITGTWKKTSDAAPTVLYDSSGVEIPLVRGEIFMQSVPPGTAVTYK
jgi:Protein of unknown function (DUF3048) N-terminal domain/Protein of unknown function (DUF3048) C-terminal domain